MTEPRTAWDDIQDLVASVGCEARFELSEVVHPPLICKPIPHDWDWPTATTPMPDDMDEALVCRIHPGEWWPCETQRERGGVTLRPTTVESVFTMRPRDEG